MDIISYILEKGLQWLYATRKKHLVHRMIVGVLFLIWFVLGVTCILYIFETFLLNCLGSNESSFTRILYVVVSVVLSIILINWGTGKDKYSEVFLSCYFLFSRRRKRNNWKRNFFLWCVIGFLISMLLNEMYIFVQTLMINRTETLIVGLVSISLFIYLLLTECVIDEMDSYRVKAIASVCLFFIVLFFYCTQMANISFDDEGNVYDIMIFAIGQFAFAETAISNYKNIYKKIKEEKEKELMDYLKEVDRRYEKNEETLRCGLKEIKIMRRRIADIWSHMSMIKKIKNSLILLVIISVCVLLAYITILIEKNLFIWVFR